MNELIYEDDDYRAYWTCDDTGEYMWFEIEGKGLTPGTKDANYDAALAVIGERFLTYCMNEGNFFDFRTDREP